MALPSLIEIVPLRESVEAEITVPGSKSITNRALVLAALADGRTILRGALWSEDTQVMVDALGKLGFELLVEPDASDAGNRTISITVRSGTIPNAGTSAQPLDLFVGNAGTAARFLSALVCLGRGVYRLHGVPRMHERPQDSLFSALGQLGYRIEAPNGKLPAVIHGSGPHVAECKVSIEKSSQFASALLLCATRGGWRVKVVGENAEESAYVKMTSELQRMFPQQGGVFDIEPDASSGSYFWAAGHLQSLRSNSRPPIKVHDWPRSGLQIDARFPEFLDEDRLSRLQPPDTISRQHHLGDSIMTAIVLAPFRQRPTKFADLGRLRVQECERVMALRVELGKCGAKVVEVGETLEIFPSTLHGAEIETYHDHRMAMCFAVVGLNVPGIRIRNPACVNKTFPNFFQKLATPPPNGLGATILDAQTRRQLALTELFAD